MIERVCGRQFKASTLSVTNFHVTALSISTGATITAPKQFGCKLSHACISGTRQQRFAADSDCAAGGGCRSTDVQVTTYEGSKLSGTNNTSANVCVSAERRCDFAHEKLRSRLRRSIRTPDCGSRWRWRSRHSTTPSSKPSGIG